MVLSCYMNIDPETYQQFESLLGTDTAGSLSPTINVDTNAIMATLLPFLVISVLISLLFAVLYVLSIIRKFRVEKAIFETRDILREMNERQKALATPVTVPTKPAPTTTESSPSN